MQKSTELQTILGAGGAIGTDLARELRAYTDSIRLVSRHPEKINPTDELFPADLTDAGKLDKAVEDSAVVYLTVGFPYDIRVWRETWPPLMRSVVDACARHGARLVFFDNVYMYDREHLAHMTEDTPVRPTSRKGEVRAEVARVLMDAVEKGRLSALIARSADFLASTNSVLVELGYKNLAKGKKADWFADADKIHSFTFGPDAAKGTAMLGNTRDAFDQVWHLPTDPTPLTGRQWIEHFASAMGVEPRVRVMPVWSMTLVGLFVPVVREFKEMVYQYDRDYFFDSAKFTGRFEFTPTAPEQAVRAITG